MRLDLLAALNREVAARRACVMATFLDDDAQQLFLADEAPQDTLGALALEALRGGRSRLVTIDGREIFLTVATPAPRLVLIGAVHVAQALAPMARFAGFDVTIVDPREAFASVERFRNVSLVNQWPQDAFAQTPLDAYCAVVLLTHDPKIDDPALHAALDA
jgi:xanthine dehydrogenase accessory factor